MPSDETLKLLEVAGAWAAAIATFAAVVVSLWLARTSNRVKLEPYCAVVLLLDGYSAVDEAPEFVSFRITNIGMRTATLQGIGWEAGFLKWGPFRKKYAIQKTDGYQYNPTIPIKLADGEVAHYLVQLRDDEDNYFRRFQPDFAFNWVYRHTLRFVAYTSGGDKFRVKPDDSFYKAMDETIAGTKTHPLAALQG